MDPEEMFQKFQQQYGAGGGAAGPAEAAPMVYMGSDSRYPNQGRRDWDVDPKGPPKQVPREMTLDGALNRIYEDEKYLAKVRRRLIAAGLITPEQAAQISNVEKVWGDTLETASKYWAKGRKLTPWDVLELQKKEYSKAGGQTPGAASPSVHAPYGLDPETGKPKGRFQTATNTSTSVNDVSDGDAWAMMQNAAAQALGREVSHEEVREFAYRANQIAAENPDEVTSTQTVDGRTGSSHTTTSRSTGFNQNDAQRMAQEELEDTPEAGAYQASTTYFNALLGALDSPVSM